MEIENAPVLFSWKRRNAWRALSNFEIAPMAIDGKQYPSVEHYFQANKATTDWEHEMVRLAASKLDHKDSQASTYCAMAKRFATDVGFNVCNDALQLFGGYGYIKEYPMERHVRDTRVHQILEGTNEIMRVIVSRKMLMDGALEVIK